MIHGKRGFDRLVYACKTVFNNPLTWLICNPESSGRFVRGFRTDSVTDNRSAPDPDPLAPHSPISFHATQTLSEAQTVLVPPLRPSSTILSDRGRLTDYATETYEWLSLVRLASPRVEIGDDIDPYLSRYRVPDGEPSEGASEMKEARVRKITWAGFISSQWARDCLVNSLVAIPSRTWFSMSMASVHNTVVGDAAELTFLRPPGSPGEYVLWDIEPAEL